MRKTVLLLLLLLTASVFPDVSRGSVRQDLGTYDALSVSLTSSECLGCHSAGGDGVSARHHLLTLTGSLCAGCHVATGAATPAFTNSTSAVSQSLTRECAACHVGTAHHSQSTGCTRCHGSAVAETDDAHYIPDGSFDMTTPVAAGTGPGHCTYCHDKDDSTSLPVVSTLVAHHGMSFETFSCGICHGLSSDIVGVSTIRDCQQCHGIDTLHNIQADGDGDGVVTILGEPSGRGHAGDPADCRGCHTIDMSLPAGIGNVVPFISSIDVAIVKMGTSSVITIFGTAFKSRDAGGTSSPAPAVVISGPKSARLPTVFSGNNLQATLPALPPGSYTLYVEKGDKRSNAFPIAVVPAAVISSVLLEGDIMSIAGAGFGTADPLLLEKSPVSVDGVPCTVISWSDNLIKASAASSSSLSVLAGSIVKVTTLFDTATSVMNAFPKPEITSAEWVKGTVTVAGTNFGPALSSNTLSINGVECTIVSWADNAVVATTSADPADKATVLVVSRGGSASAQLAVRRVTIQSAEWMNGTLMVRGTGFGAGGSAGNVVSVEGVNAPVITWGDTLITAELAEAPVSGAMLKVEAQYGSATAPLLVKAVSIASVTWSKGGLTISGSGFGKQGSEVNAVHLDMKLLPIISWSETKIVAAQKSSPAQNAMVTVEAEYGSASMPFRKKKN